MAASVYENRLPSYYEPYLRRFRPLSPPLLELGSGFGLLLELATSMSIECYGLEFDANRVTLCKAKGLNVQQRDLGEAFPFENNTFGAIYCGQVIEHMNPIAQKVMLREAFRVLRPGGQFQLCSPCRHNESARLQKGHDYLLTPSELNAMLGQAGFAEIDLSINFPQNIPEIPPEELKRIWKLYQPDLLSATANAMCRK